MGLPLPVTISLRYAWHHAATASRVLGLVAVCALPWVRLNITASVPRGLYRLAAISAPLRVGDLVLLPTPEAVAHIHTRWLPILKPVAAVVGEEVCVEQDQLVIRGEDYGPLWQVTEGQAMPHLPTGCFTVEVGTVFLASPVARSLDGRYWGPTALHEVTARAVPLLIWR